jgi:predicted nucleic acid-binding protein
MSKAPQTGGVYLDCNILIAAVTQTDTHTDDVNKTLDVLSRLSGINLFVSEWAIAEMKKVLVASLNYPLSNANKIAKRLKQTSQLRGHRFSLISVSPKTAYGFEDFFESLFDFLTMRRRKGRGINGIADAMHCSIMKNYKISMILSTDAGSGLDLAPNQILLKPKELAKEF